MGFWKNFIDAFELNGSKLYLTGESYAGVSVMGVAVSHWRIQLTSSAAAIHPLLCLSYA